MTPRPPRDREGRYRNASEVGSFLFCQRVWMYEQQGAPSEREPERAAGTVYHQQHGERVEAAERTGSLARLVLMAAIILIILALLVGML